MQSKNHTVTIEVAQSPEEVFKHLNDVSNWWTRDFEGKSTNLNDEFTITHPGSHYSKHKLIEIIPNKKVVWLITESKLAWLKKDQPEWTGTKMIFELTSRNDKTIINFTHEGLVPEMECYDRVKEGWNLVIKERLFNFLAGHTDQ